jgi:hypothetical protein
VKVDDFMDETTYKRLAELAKAKARRENTVEHFEYVITHLKDLPRTNQLELFNALILELACT